MEGPAVPRPADYVFATALGNVRTINNVRERILTHAIKFAYQRLEAEGLVALPVGLDAAQAPPHVRIIC